MAAASARWSCSYEDALGRTICEERPGFNGTLLVTSNEYNIANQLIATRTFQRGSGGGSGVSPLDQNGSISSTLLCYNVIGQRTLTVSDMNRNGQIDWNDTDRIVANDTRYAFVDNAWWRESSTWQTRQNGSPELTLMGRTRTRLTGIGTMVGGDVPGAPQGNLISESHALDPLGNVTISRTYRDRTAHTTIQTTDTPSSTLAAVTTVQSGLTVSSRSPTGVTTTYAYDALGRQVAVTDPLGHTVTTVYDAEGRVLTQRGAKRWRWRRK